MADRKLPEEIAGLQGEKIILLDSMMHLRNFAGYLDVIDCNTGRMLHRAFTK